MQCKYGYRPIDPATWDRGRHFELFSRLGYPYVGITVQTDVTELARACNETGRRFFTAMLFILSDAVNAVENFRYRIHEGRVILCDRIDPHFTVMHPDTELFYFAGAAHTDRYADFERSVSESKAAALESRHLVNDRLDALYATCLPWFSFTDIIQPLGINSGDTVPRFAWGACRNEGGRSVLSLSVTAHHGFVDGLHVAKLLERMRGLLDAPEFLLCGTVT